jgi:hypothetical protein
MPEEVFKAVLVFSSYLVLIYSSEYLGLGGGRVGEGSVVN